MLVEDRLFATLDSTVRLVELSPAHRILLSDTVGFIRKLPHHLVASFKTTLDEVVEADILLHVVDISNPLFEEQISIVNNTLEEIGAQGKPTILVFNKIDRVSDRSIIQYLAKSHVHAVFISAARGINMGALEKKIIELLEDSMTDETLTLGQKDYAVISKDPRPRRDRRKEIRRRADHHSFPHEQSGGGAAEESSWVTFVGSGDGGQGTETRGLRVGVWHS